MESKQYTHAITRKPPLSMANGISSQKVTVNVELARTQHETYIKTLKERGLAVTVLEPEEDFPDSHFVEDVAIIHNNIAILTRPGAQVRRNEVKCIKPALEKIMPVKEVPDHEDLLLDGGDVLFMGNQVFIGIYDRTNLKGANCLKGLLNDIDPKLNVHFIPFSGVLHLKSGLTALGPNLLLGNPLIKLQEPLPQATIHWLPEEQGYAANTLTVNGGTFYFSESTAAQTAIEKTHLQPIGLDLSEFRKMDGSFTCLSLLW